MRIRTVAEPIGAFTFVLHSHLPYCRRAGRWPHGEEWLHEAASETYLPLLRSLNGLRERGSRFQLTIGLTPILCEQLADATVIANLASFIEEKEKRAAADVNRFEKAGEAQRAGVAGWYLGFYQDLHRFFDGLDRDILGGFKRLQDQGYIEVATSA